MVAKLSRVLMVTQTMFLCTAVHVLHSIQVCNVVGSFTGFDFALFVCKYIIQSSRKKKSE